MHSAARKPNQNNATGSSNGVAFSVDQLFGDSSTPKRGASSAASINRPNSIGRATNGFGSTASGSSPANNDHGYGYTPKSSSKLMNGSSPIAGSSPSTSISQQTPSKTGPFSDRKDKLSIIDSFNSDLALPNADQRSGMGSSNFRVALSSTMDPKKYNYRIAYERPMERSEALDSAIDEAAELLRDWYGIEEYCDPTTQSQDDIIVCGRLCPETDQAKMTPTSTWLESSRALGSGFRVLLKFQPEMKVRGGPVGAGGVGLFPGCMVALRGRNGGGKLFAVDEVMMMPPIDASTTAPSQMLAQQHGDKQRQLNGNPMSIIVAAGPYTVDSDLRYEPLTALLELAQAERPDLLILLGPFVDSDHPKIRKGDIDMMPDDLFKSQISTKLSTLLQASPRTTIILIPNQRDLVNQHVAYPQSPFAREALNLPKGVKLLPNPTTFSVNEVVFAITSVDVLFGLRNQEIFQSCGEVKEEGDEIDPTAKDTMSRTCRHLLRQRSFYPLFPAPMGPLGGPGLNLDVTHQDLIKMGSTGADVFILPSIMKSFTKIVDSAIMLNPSFLTRGNQAGSFARLTIHPMERSFLEEAINQGSDEEIEHRVWERTRIDVVKI